MNPRRVADGGSATFASLQGNDGEPNVDEVLAQCPESTPEEVMALDEQPDERLTTRESSPPVPEEEATDETFDGFVREEPRRVRDPDRESVEDLGGPSMDELFGTH